MSFVSKLYSCAFSPGLLRAVISCLSFVLSSSLKRKIARLKSRLEVLNLVPWVQSTIWLWLLYQADVQARGGCLGRNLRIPRSVTPFFGFMESLGGLFCAKHVPFGKEWGWDERRNLRAQTFAADLGVHQGELASCSCCTPPWTTHRPNSQNSRNKRF